MYKFKLLDLFWLILVVGLSITLLNQITENQRLKLAWKAEKASFERTKVMNSELHKTLVEWSHQIDNLQVRLKIAEND